MLYDVDKNSEDRGSPMPNHDDKLIGGAIKSHRTISTHYSSDADQSNTRLQMQNKQIVGNNGTSQIVNYGVQSDGNFALKFFDANGVGVARFGQYADGSIALKVAKSGQEVDTATATNLIFNSSQDVFKVVSTLNISATATAGNQYTTASVAHGQTFVPAILAYIQVPTSLSGANPAINHANPAMIYGTVAGVFRIFALCEVTVDATNITMAIQTDTSVVGGSYTFSAKVYLLQETFS